MAAGPGVTSLLSDGSDLPVPDSTSAALLGIP